MTKALIDEMAANCLVTRARLVARVTTGIYDDAFRPFGINSPQFILLVIIAKVGPVTRSALGRFHRQDRSTLSRNLQIMLQEGWIREETVGEGRGRPLVATAAGLDLLGRIEPAWRAGQLRTAGMLGNVGGDVMLAVGNELLDRDGLR